MTSCVQRPWNHSGHPGTTGCEACKGQQYVRWNSPQVADLTSSILHYMTFCRCSLSCFQTRNQTGQQERRTTTPSPRASVHSSVTMQRTPFFFAIHVTSRGPEALGGATATLKLAGARKELRSCMISTETDGRRFPVHQKISKSVCATRM